MDTNAKKETVAYKHSESTLYATDDPDFISFEFGAPGQSLLPTSLMPVLAQHLASKPDAYTSLQYGPTLGDAEFRDELAKWLTKEYDDGVPVRRNNLCVTSGASQSLSNIVTLFTNKDTRILIEDPTYFLAIRVFQDHGFAKESLINIPVDNHGILVDEVEQHLARLSSSSSSSPQNAHPSPTSNTTNDDSTADQTDFLKRTKNNDGAKRFPYLLYIVPTFSNPTGYSLSDERRKKLIDIARRYDVLVVCDDVYQILNYSSTKKPPKRLVAYDDLTNGFGNVISNCSFSKIFAPGVRLGWIEAPSGIIDQFLKAGLTYSGGSLNHYTSKLMTSAIQIGALDTHLSRLRSTYSSRLQAMCEYLKENLPHNARFEVPEGGFFIWIRLNIDSEAGIDTAELMQALKQQPGERDASDGVVHVEYNGKRVPKEKVSFAPGKVFSPAGGYKNYLRLTFALYELPDLLKGCERLCRVLKNVC
ncbi:hypothetical protein HK102_012800 [Quaeritorhiza haematococci]|nr:hypothetical protein HK102_012800 [Quaeritorhiza haematococci]